MSTPLTSWSELDIRYETTGVRTQLGATTAQTPSVPPDARGIFTLTRSSLDNAIENTVKPADMSSYVVGFNREATDDYAYRTYLVKRDLVSFANSFGGEGTQMFWAGLLTDVLEDTGSPAMAVQAINTAATRMLYTHWMGSFTAGGTADITYLTEFSVPGAVAGYVVVVVVVATQVVLLVVVGAMFGACRNSVLNDAWLVISQVSSSPEALGGLVKETAVTDAEVRQFVREDKGFGLRKRLMLRDGAFRGLDSD